MLTVKPVRHGEWQANVGAVQLAEVGDQTIELTPCGIRQANNAGERIGADFLSGALLYTSPFTRARQTLAGVLDGAGVPRLACSRL